MVWNRIRKKKKKKKENLEDTTSGIIILTLSALKLGQQCDTLRRSLSLEEMSKPQNEET